MTKTVSAWIACVTLAVASVGAANATTFLDDHPADVAAMRSGPQAETFDDVFRVTAAPTLGSVALATVGSSDPASRTFLNVTSVRFDGTLVPIAADTIGSEARGGTLFDFRLPPALRRLIASGPLARLASYLGASVESPVPEPSTWAMMIAGFGVTGGAIRGTSRRATRRSPAA